MSEEREATFRHRLELFRENSDVQAVPPSSWIYGVCDIGGTFGSAYDERFSAEGGIATSLFSASLNRRVTVQYSTVHDGYPGMARTICADVGHTLGGGVVQGDCDDGRFPVGVGCDANGQDSPWCLVPADGALAHKRAGDARAAFGTQTLSNLLSRRNLLYGEWTPHTQVVAQIWKRYNQADVDLFAS